MARITVEDCLQNEPNLFNLVLLAAKRARRLANGAEATVEWENDKPTVVALREIAAGNITLEMLEEPEEPVPAAGERARHAVGFPCPATRPWGLIEAGPVQERRWTMRLPYSVFCPVEDAPPGSVSS